MPGPILFVSHDATRTGAPIALLNLLKHVARHGEPRFEVLLRGGGPMESHFRELAPVTHWSAEDSGPVHAEPRLLDRLWKSAGRAGHDPAPPSRTATLLDHFKSLGVSLIYSNTITNGEVLEALAPLGVPVITHVHELDYWMSHRMSADALRQARDRTDLFIAVSGAVTHALTRVAGIPEERIVTVHGSIELPDQAASVARRTVRARLGIADDAFVVGISGTMDWRKGVDLLAPLAVEVERLRPAQPTHWMWVGGESEGPVAGMIQHDFTRCDLEARLHLTGTVDAPLEAFSAFDVFVVLSREDPFPLVMLEAASLGLPVVCFDAAGGSKEFVRDDAGFVVPYLDLPAMAGRLAELSASPERRRTLGDAAARRVRADHDVDVVAPRIVDLIQTVRSRHRA